MDNFNILTKKNSAVAILHTSSDELSNLESSGFKIQDEVKATDKEQALTLWLADNKPKRSFISRVNKWVYISFHALMLFWWLSYTSDVAGMMNGSEASNAGAAIGGAIGTSMIFTIWGLFGFFGAFIVYMTRVKDWNK